MGVRPELRMILRGSDRVVILQFSGTASVVQAPLFGLLLADSAITNRPLVIDLSGMRYLSQSGADMLRIGFGQFPSLASKTRLAYDQVNYQLVGVIQQAFPRQIIHNSLDEAMEALGLTKDERDFARSARPIRAISEGGLDLFSVTDRSRGETCVYELGPDLNVSGLDMLIDMVEEELERGSRQIILNLQTVYGESDFDRTPLLRLETLAASSSTSLVLVTPKDLNIVVSPYCDSLCQTFPAYNSLEEALAALAKTA